ncbi:squalene monooxygenase erg1 [Lichtheimia corymbifera JMRC:FSU:9682]|uniref:Squalene monooxygenase n=1 Tax=Lichtheimia corymbifera JMRC:FSU:9682 TaxID=1263082 RepID=A0A068RQR0_9FUNG|nr:squalene monooxygenase erg1 [Lichtheimia corymbifera JMRC:FSU:9682]
MYTRGRNSVFSFSSVTNSGYLYQLPFCTRSHSYLLSNLSMPSIVESSSEYDLIIVGAGVLGSAAAKAFGSDGRRVLLLERDLSEPDRIVDCLEGIDGIPCHGYAIYRENEWVHIPYPVNDATGENAVGKSFHHGRFIQKLRAAARDTKNVEVKEATVTSLIKDEDDDRVIGVLANPKDGKEEKFYAPLTLVADGLFSKFRKEFTEKTPDVRSYFAGFEIKGLTMPMPNHGHVILVDPSPVLMYQIGSNETRVLIDVPGKLPSIANGDLKRYFEESIAPQLPESIRPKFLEALQTERLRSMPNGFLPPSVNQNNGLIILGDAMNMRHPLTGGGMTVALQDVVLLKELLSPESIPSFTETDVIIQQMGAFHWARKRYCTAINVLAMALYRLFSAQDSDLAVLQRGCFEYFKCGGKCISEPCGLLSGLIQRPIVLIYHFFAVAVYALVVEFKRAGWSQAHISFIKIFTVLYAACVTIFPYLWSETKN